MIFLKNVMLFVFNDQLLDQLLEWREGEFYCIGYSKTDYWGFKDKDLIKYVRQEFKIMKTEGKLIWCPKCEVYHIPPACPDGVPPPYTDE